MGHGISVVLISLMEKTISFIAKLCFDCINNIVKYEPCAIGIQVIFDLEVKYLKAYRVSTLVIHQLRGNWET